MTMLFAPFTHRLSPPDLCCNGFKPMLISSIASSKPVQDSIVQVSHLHHSGTNGTASYQVFAALLPAPSPLPPPPPPFLRDRNLKCCSRQLGLWSIALKLLPHASALCLPQNNGRLKRSCTASERGSLHSLSRRVTVDADVAAETAPQMSALVGIVKAHLRWFTMLSKSL